MHTKKTTTPLLFILFLLISFTTHAQQSTGFTAATKNAFFTTNAAIENIGQYGISYKGQEAMGNILYGFEGHNMPILFTNKGLIKKFSRSSDESIEKLFVHSSE